MTGRAENIKIIAAERRSAEENFAEWRAAVASLFAPTAENGDVSRFRADLSTYHLGRFIIAKSSASPQSFLRSNELVEAVGVDHLLVQLYLAGACSYDADGAKGEARAGDTICFDLSRPMHAVTTDANIVSVILPRALVHLNPCVIDTLHGARLDGCTSSGALMREQLTAMARVAPALSQSGGDLATEVASTLISSGLSAATALEQEARQDADLHSIQVFIESHLADPKLSIEIITAEFALSRSALYRLFEPLGGVVDYIRERRLKRAALRLSSAGRGRGAVARLAYMSGFASESAFSRAFTQRFGLRPSEAIGRLDGSIKHEAAAIKRPDNWMQHWLERLGCAHDEPLGRFGRNLGQFGGS